MKVLKFKGGLRMAEEQNRLSARKKQILKAIVEEHMRGGEPVGSKYLTES